MSSNRIKVFVLLLLLVASIFTVISSANPHVVVPSFSPAIPRVWDDAEMEALQLPLVNFDSLAETNLGRLLLPNTRQNDLQKLSRVCARQGAGWLHGMAQTTGAAIRF